MSLDYADRIYQGQCMLFSWKGFENEIKQLGKNV